MHCHSIQDIFYRDPEGGILEGVENSGIRVSE